MATGTLDAKPIISRHRMGLVRIDPPTTQELVVLDEDERRVFYRSVELKTLYKYDKLQNRWFRMYLQTARHNLNFKQKQKAREALALFDGTGVHDRPDNVCRNDPYFGRSIQEQYGMPIDELRQIVSQ